MFSEYVSIFAAALVIAMLVTFVLLVLLLDSLGHRYRVADVVGLMGTTSVITACAVSVCLVPFVRTYWQRQQR
jgi:hypothetical protein